MSRNKKLIVTHTVYLKSHNNYMYKYSIIPIFLVILHTILRIKMFYNLEIKRAINLTHSFNFKVPYLLPNLTSDDI